MAVPADLIPRCPVCGAPMAMNLRADDTFVQDEGWYAAYRRYEVSSAVIHAAPFSIWSWALE